MIDCTQIILEYLKVIVSWPIALVTIVILLINNFKDAISYWIKRLKIQHGDIIISSQVLHNKIEIDSEKNLTIESPKENKDKTNSTEMLNWRENAYIWEYRFLNYYLVHYTHLTLDWLCDLGEETTYIRFDTEFNSIIRHPEERHAVISALEQHHLITFRDRKIEITEKGREYINYMGRTEKRNMTTIS